MDCKCDLSMVEFSRIVPFNDMNVGGVHQHPGVYVIYRSAEGQHDEEPMYVGRSQVDIHRRLMAHLHGRGSKAVGEIARLKPKSLSF